MSGNKLMSIFELTLIVLSSFAFAYFVSTDLPDIFEKQNSIVQYLTKPILPVVSASDNLPSGCCKETMTGATCQEMVIQDKALCKTDLIGTSCNVVSECQKGCCYDADSGICSLNAPRDACVSNGGEWDPSSTCNIAQCQVGCCILGDGATMTTTRECTEMASDLRMEKVFKPLDSKGTCDAYSDPTDMGACLFKSDDYSGEMNCIFTTKAKCVNSGREFKRDYLCTSKELNTTCEKTTKTTCIDGDDRVYFVDSCGNKANVYDAKRADDDSYWEKIILPRNSCDDSPETCGNCNYVDGSICTKYVSGKDVVKPEMGDYVCKNLNCVNGKKHGESWCVSDTFNMSRAGSAVGNRNYVASCFEGEIKIEGCADFNQEICIENKNKDVGYTEAMCTPNDWRSCIYANDYDNYAAIESKCKTLPQCIMFNDIPGNEKYAGLPGFKENVINDKQGSAGDLGEGMNKYVMQCVPKYTPGYQFWNSAYTSVSSILKGEDAQADSTNTYGGSKAETDALCSLSTFRCVSHIVTTSPMINPTPHDAENPECNMQAVSQSNQKVELMMEALNEKCRMLGSCGMQYNTQGDLGSLGFSVSRIYVDKKGKSHEGYSTKGYVYPEDYFNRTAQAQNSIKLGQIETLSELTGSNPAENYDQSALTVGDILSSANLSDSIEEVAADASGIVGSGGGDVVSLDESLGTNTAVAAAALSFAGAYAASYYSTTFTTTIVGSGWTVTGTGYSSASSLAQATSQVGSHYGGSSVVQASTTTSSTSSSLSNLAGGLTMMGITLVAAVIGSYVGKMIAKSAGMTPGESTALIGAMSSLVVAGTLGVVGGVALASSMAVTAAATAATTAATAAALAGGATASAAAAAGAAAGTAAAAAAAPAAGSFAAACSWLCAIPILCLVGVIIAIAFMIYSLFSGEDNEYYITEFACQAWQPPAVGNCEACNEDVRPCSEYKCRSLGANCRYFVDNGEPGYCATMADIWSAKITPWEDKISHGNKYTNVSSNSFRIVSNDSNSKEVQAWKTIKFGVITDDQATCKLDTNHSMKYNEMRYTMISDVNYATGKLDGMHHWIAVSPNVVTNENESDWGTTTPPMNEGENEYYIICQNFAGETNDAPFVVQIKQAEGPDLTPADVTRIVPSDKSYLAYKSNSTNLWLYVDEPAECRYSLDYDYNTYEEMPNNMSCLTGKDQSFYGEWPCMTIIPNITQTTKVYVKCKDQPELIENEIYKRNQNRKSFEYEFYVCQTGLEITSITPKGIVEVNSSKEVDLEVRTAGCINNGDAECTYRLPYYGDTYSTFLNTGRQTHSQPLTDLGSGERTVDVVCIDRAGNTANTSVNFTVFYDDYAPGIIRIYEEKDKLVLETNEEANCAVNINDTKACDFKITSSNTFVTKHSISLSDKTKKQTLYIRCEDSKGNTPNGCTEIIKLVDIKDGD